MGEPFKIDVAVRYRVCDPDYDDTVWADVPDDPTVVLDAVDAAKRYATAKCRRDYEYFAAFNTIEGVTLMVRGPNGTKAVRVFGELVRSFTGREL